MRRFAFLYTLMTMSMMFIVDENDGAGGDATGENGDNANEGGTDDNTDTNSDNNNDVGNQEIDDESDDGATTLTPEETAQARELLETNARNEMLSEVEKSIQGRTPDFSMTRVVKGLKELNETDPKMAAYYNASEAGLEMFFRDKLANVAENDSVNNGSHAGSNSDFDSVLDKAKAGDKKSVNDALAMSKA